MIDRHVAATVALCRLLTLAGCGFFQERPGPSTMTVEYSFQNDGTDTFEVKLSLLPQGLSGATVADANGTTDTVDGTSLQAIERNLTEDAVIVRPRGPEMDRRNHTLEPRSGVGSQFEDVPTNSTLVTVLRGPGSPRDIRTWAVSHCGPGTTQMTERTTISANRSLASSLGRSM
jgi:hypothetical protein